MNETLQRFLAIQKEMYEEEKQKNLMELGLYEKEYAPIVGYGRIKGENKIVKFPITYKTKLGDTMTVSRNGEKVDVIIERIESKESPEFPFYERDSIDFVPRYYKKLPVQISDEEYQEVKKYVKEGIKEKHTYEKNKVSAALLVIAVIIYIGGFIGGFAFIDMNFAFVVGCWCAAFINGTIFLGFSEIIKLLNTIKNNGE